MRWQRALVLAALVAAGVAGVHLAKARRSTATTPPHAAAATTVASAPVQGGPRHRTSLPTSRATTLAQVDPSRAHRPGNDDALVAVRAAIADPSPEGTAALVSMLDGEDSVAQLEAIDELVERGHVAALSRLAKMDPADDPYIGPSIIVALGELGRAAPDEATRHAALDRLVALLAQEKERNGSDSIGNVITIIEAIGALGHPDGAAALERELGDPFHDVASQTTIVLALGRLGQSSSIAALARFRATLTPGRADEDLDRELEKELFAAIDEVSRSLSRR